MTKLLPKVNNGFARYPSSPFPVGGDILNSESHKKVFFRQFPLEVAFENSAIFRLHATQYFNIPRAEKYGIAMG